jgi:hypothetical protein
MPTTGRRSTNCDRRGLPIRANQNVAKHTFGKPSPQ